MITVNVVKFIVLKANQRLQVVLKNMSIQLKINLIRVKKLNCENGKEYLNKEIYQFTNQKGVELLPCPPYVYQLNGVAERFNRAAMDIGRCLLRVAKIP